MEPTEKELELRKLSETIGKLLNNSVFYDNQEPREVVRYAVSAIAKFATEKDVNLTYLIGK